MLKLILQNLLFIQKILIIMEKVLRKVANGNFLLKSEEKKLFTLQAEKRGCHRRAEEALRGQTFPARRV